MKSLSAALIVLFAASIGSSSQFTKLTETSWELQGEFAPAADESSCTDQAGTPCAEVVIQSGEGILVARLVDLEWVGGEIVPLKLNNKGQLTFSWEVDPSQECDDPSCSFPIRAEGVVELVKTKSGLMPVATYTVVNYYPYGNEDGIDEAYESVETKKLYWRPSK